MTLLSLLPSPATKNAFTSMERCSPTDSLLPGLFWAFLLFCAMPACAQSTIEKSLRLEARGEALLLDHYRVEQALVVPDPQRLTVFLTQQPGPHLMLEEATLLLDGKPVARHRYTPADLDKLGDGATQPLFVGQIPAGEHSLRLELRARAGKIQPMSNFSFTKSLGPKYVELRIGNEAARQIKASAW